MYIVVNQNYLTITTKIMKGIIFLELIAGLLTASFLIIVIIFCTRYAFSLVDDEHIVYDVYTSTE
jgi:hypothetical protein